VQRLDRIVDAVPGLDSSSRVLDVGSGIGALIPHLQRAGVADILAVDLSAGMLAKLRQRFPDPGPLGNELGVRSSTAIPVQTVLRASISRLLA
jgi:ubiquinone/menaquinone biosynthesis C-methylase UbiE